MQNLSSSPRKSWSNRSGSAGFSLPETLIGAAVLVIVVGAIVPLLWIAAGQQGGQADRLSALDQDRVAFDNMTRLIRQASSVQALDAEPPASPGATVAVGKLQLTTGDPARDPLVIDCAIPAEAAGRYLCLAQGADGSSRRLIEGITNPAPFAVDPSHAFVSVNLQLSPPGASRPVSLQGGVSLRVGAVG